VFQQPHYHAVAHTHNIYNNKQSKKAPSVPTSLPPSQPFLPPPPRLPQHIGREYNLVKQLYTTSAKISLLYLIQTSPTYHRMLQEAIQKVNVPPSIRPNNVASLFSCMHATMTYILFQQHELPPIEVQNQYEPLMIFVIINRMSMRRTMIDGGVIE